jgi:hypothetical protein
MIHYRYVRTALSLNAVTGQGGKYGEMDETTAKGMDPEVLAEVCMYVYMCVCVHRCVCIYVHYGGMEK